MPRCSLVAAISLVLGACASPQFDCARFPVFGDGIDRQAANASGVGTEMLREAESFDPDDVTALAAGYVSLGDYQAAADLVRRHPQLGWSRPAVILVIESSAAAGATGIARQLIDEFGSRYLDHGAETAFASGRIRAGEMDDVLADMDIRLASNGGVIDGDAGKLEVFRDRLRRSRHREALDLLDAALATEATNQGIFYWFDFRGRSYIAGRADLVTADNVDAVVAEIEEGEIEAGIATHSVLFAAARVYAANGDRENAAIILDEGTEFFIQNPSSVSEGYLIATLALQLEIGAETNRRRLLTVFGQRLANDEAGQRRDVHNRRRARQLVWVLFTHGYSSDAYWALDTIAEPRSERYFRSAIAWAEAASGNLETALSVASGTSDPLGSCWATADIANATAMFGDVGAALDIALRIQDEPCTRNAGFAPFPNGLFELPGTGQMPPQTDFDDDLFAAIAVSASYHGEGGTACAALNSDPLYQPWIDAVSEVATRRAAAGDYGAAMEVVRQARSIRSADPEIWSDIVSRMVTQNPPPWTPPL